MLKVVSMANITNFTDMINALPKQEMDFIDDHESPVSPPASTPTSEPPIIVDRFLTPNGITSISSGEIILPKRSQVTDLLKNGPLSAAVCVASNQKGAGKLPRNTGMMYSSAVTIPNTVPQYVQSLITPTFANSQQKQIHSLHSNAAKMPSVKIVEQPAENRVRFRFPIEGRSAGSIAGVSSTLDNKTFPTVEVVGYKGPAKVVVSCVEDKFHTEQNGYKTYRAHPHNLVGKHCKEGVCIMDISEETMACQFSNIGVQCVTKRQIEASLQIRKRIQVDPFGLGFDHKNSDRTTVRLCFQVFLKPKEGGLLPLLPVVSSLIKDKRAHPDLNIVDISDDTSPVQGGKKILLFCSKIKKEDIEVVFLHYGKNGEEILTTKGEFGETNVHDQSGISFKTPPYPDLEITEPAKVSICLRQPSKNMQSEPQDFWYLPNSSKIAERNASLDNDLKQKILMIQRIAGEAKLPDFGIKKEDEMDQKKPANGTFTPPPVNLRSSDLPTADRLGKHNKSTPEKPTDASSCNMSHTQKTRDTFKNAASDKPLQVKSRFPLTGSYGGIINITSDCKEREKEQDIQKEDSGFIEPSPMNMMSKPTEPEKLIGNERAKINTFLQQEQQHLANCVRLIAADMEEFEKEPISTTKPSPSPIPVQFMSLSPHGSIIPNQEVFRGTCADDTVRLNLNPIPRKELIRFPSQPLDLSTLSTSVGILPLQLSNARSTQVKKIQNPHVKVKRKRVRKPTESISINIMPMTPMPHTTKDDGMEEEPDPSTDSGVGLSIAAPEKSKPVPKKRKRNSKPKEKDSSSQIRPGRVNSTDGYQNSPSPSSLVPELHLTSSNRCLSMPIITGTDANDTHQDVEVETWGIKKENPDDSRNDSDLDLGLVIDTDGEED